MPVESIPNSAVVDGRPQGIFVGRSLLTGRSVCLLFLADGRLSRSIPMGGLEAFDWARHAADHAGDCGTWQLVGAELSVTWGDGGVQQGPLTVHDTGIEFYGKRYSRPPTVEAGALVGRWESASGTALMGGAGVNRLSTLVIEPGARYQWAETLGGVVEGLAVAGGSSTSGSLLIAVHTITFNADDGSRVAATFLPVAGSPLEAFTIDADMFTRSGD